VRYVISRGKLLASTETPTLDWKLD
jgi:hypothetical protein